MSIGLWLFLLVRFTLSPESIISDIAIFVLKGDVKLQLTTNSQNQVTLVPVGPIPMS